MDAIVVEHVSKRFRILTIPKQASLKQAIVGLKVLDLSKRKTLFVEAINDVSFRVPAGTTLGIIGKNGSGKSTLLRLLAGIYTPDQGTLRVRGDIAPLLSLGIGFHPEMTGRENVKLYGLVLGLSPREIESKFEEIVEFAELRDFIDVPVKVYSSGMYMRLAFSVAVSVDPDILLLDEVLAVGDEAFAAKCYARIQEFKKQGKTIVLVTHSTSTLHDFCEKAMWIDEGSIRLARRLRSRCRSVSSGHAGSGDRGGIMPHGSPQEAQIVALQSLVEKLRRRIDFIERSSFWKIREQWFALKGRLGLRSDPVPPLPAIDYAETMDMQDPYARWLIQHEPRAADLRRLRQIAQTFAAPSSICVIVDDASNATDAIKSVLEQAYPWVRLLRTSESRKAAMLW